MTEQAWHSMHGTACRAQHAWHSMHSRPDRRKGGCQAGGDGNLRKFAEIAEFMEFAEMAKFADS